MGAESFVYNTRGCKNGSTLRYGAGVLVIFGDIIFYSDSVGKLGVMVIFACEAELCL